MSSFLTTYSGMKVRIPDYGKACITQLPSLFRDVLSGKKQHALAEAARAGGLRLDGVRNIVFLLVDGFGSKQWNDYRTTFEALQRFEQSGYVGQLDSVFPSSTPVALNTLHASGAVPASHGLIDWWLYVEEIDKIIATLPFAPMGDDRMDSLLETGVSPSILYDGKTTYQDFGSSGIKTRVFLLSDYANSTYTQVACKDSEIIPHGNVHELFTSLSEQLRMPQPEPTYNFVYWAGIDAAGHAHGLESSEYKQAANEYFVALDEFFKNTDMPGDTLFAISADHGQVNVDPSQTVYLDAVNGFSDLLRVSRDGRPILPWGGPREVFVAIQDKRRDEALALLQAAIGQHAELISSRTALEAGLFGHTATPHPHLMSRIGDIIILPKGNKTVWYHHLGRKPFNLKGHHGGLSEADLRVPLGLLRS